MSRMSGPASPLSDQPRLRAFRHTAYCKRCRLECLFSRLKQNRRGGNVLRKARRQLLGDGPHRLHPPLALICEHALFGRTHVPSGRSGWAKAEAAFIYEDLGVATVLPATTPSQTRVCFRPEFLGPTPSLSRR